MEVYEMLLVSLLQTEREREQFRGIYKDNYLKMYHIALGYKPGNC